MSIPVMVVDMTLRCSSKILMSTNWTQLISELFRDHYQQLCMSSIMDRVDIIELLISNEPVTFKRMLSSKRHLSRIGSGL